MKNLLKKYKKISKEIDQNFDQKNTKLNQKLEKVLTKLMASGKRKKILKLIDKKSKKLKNYIFNDKHLEILKLNRKEKKEKTSDAINNFWNELAITQICAGVGPSVLTKDMKKSFDGDKKATKKIQKNIDVRKAAYQGFSYLRCL